jgi:hypothetical protein
MATIAVYTATQQYTPRPAIMSEADGGTPKQHFPARAVRIFGVQRLRCQWWHVRSSPQNFPPLISDDRTITIEHRWAYGRNEHLAEFAADFVRREVGVIVTSTTPPTIAAKQVTYVIPSCSPVEAITNAIEAYEAIRWPLGRTRDGKE